MNFVPRRSIYREANDLIILPDCGNAQDAAVAIRSCICSESGHKNAGDALRVFSETKGELQADGRNMLGELLFADKDECELQNADGRPRGSREAP